ncbi:cytochrome c oxidase subunit 6a, mitochondrial isoform X1 [Nicotiana tabacum]|uniref:Cytochrome c oxidase subunit 6a, mitochondrial isoform X1 n=1 Tax=Nicotiana tabacum TaxID=4097 RepID=A0AC58U8V1_TOBAC
MATAMFRSSIRSALRSGAPRVTPASKRTFSSHSSVEEEAREASKWEKITYVGIVSCSILAAICLSKGHPHSDEPPVQMGFLRSSTTETAWFLCEGVKIIPVHPRG